jgi:polyphenol oxidase
MTRLIRKENIYILDGAGDSFRAGVIGRAVNFVDYSADFGPVRKQEKAAVGLLTGIEEKDILFLNQTHGDDIICVEEYPARDLPCLADADAIITALPRLCAVIRTADCVPLMLFDCEQKVLGAVHSGWKGSGLGIAAKALGIMCGRYGCIPENIIAAILPSIGPLSYEIQEDVARVFPCDTRISSGKIYLDLWKNITGSLLSAKVQPENIYNAQTCTFINNADFFSHRRGDIQRNLNFAYIV